MKLDDLIKIRQDLLKTADFIYSRQGPVDTLLHVTCTAYGQPTFHAADLRYLHIASLKTPRDLAAFTLDRLYYHNDEIYGIAPDYYFEELVVLAQGLKTGDVESVFDMSLARIQELVAKRIHHKSSFKDIFISLINEGPELLAMWLFMQIVYLTEVDLIAAIKFFPLSFERLILGIFDHYRHRLAGFRKWINIMPYLKTVNARRIGIATLLTHPDLQKELTEEFGITIEQSDISTLVINGHAYDINYDIIFYEDGSYEIMHYNNCYHYLDLYTDGVAALEN